MMTFKLRLQWVKNRGSIRIRFSLEKLKDPNTAKIFQATIGGKFAPLLALENQDIDIDALINSFNTAVTETANNILGKHRPAKKPWVTDNVLKLCDKRRELKQKKNTTEGAKLYREANQQVKKGMRKAKETWIEEQCQGIEENLQKNNSKKAYQLVKELTSSKQGRTTTIQDKAGKCLRRTRHSKEVDRVLLWIVYTHNNRKSQGARCPSTNQQWHLPYPVGRSWSGSKITEERQVGRSGQHSIGAGPGRRRGHDRYVTHHLQ